MKLTVNKTNVTPAGGTYPYGNVKDNTGGANGTPVNVELLTDYVQFFEKIFADSGLTANGLPDNNTNGFQLVEAAIKVFRPYKSYVALISQTGTAAPTVTVLENQLGGAIVWTRSNVGDYGGTLAGAFPINKTIAFMGGFNSSTKEALCGRLGDNAVALLSSLSGSQSDGVLNETSLEIRVYY